MANKFSALIVDDNATIRGIHNKLLSKFEFKTCIVENGQKAVDLYHSGKCFDLVVMDMEMPIKDGPQATRELRVMGVNSIIIGVTSCGRDSEKQAFIQAGLNNCYEKPLKDKVVASLAQRLKNNN